MTATELARALNAKRVGKGKWIAKCPAHPDKRPSLSIAEGKRVPVVLKCMSMGCDTREILKAAGLRWGDLFDGRASPEIRRRVGLREQKESLERQLGLVMFLRAIDKGKERYWAAAEKRLSWEVFWVRCTLEPEKVIQEHRKRMKRK